MEKPILFVIEDTACLSEASVAIKYAILPSIYPFDNGISIETFAFANFKTEPGSSCCCSDKRGKKITTVEDIKIRTTATTIGLNNFMLFDFLYILKILLNEFTCINNILWKLNYPFCLKINSLFRCLSYDYSHICA